jgi:hypothetical protein
MFNGAREERTRPARKGRILRGSKIYGKHSLLSNLWPVKTLK